VDLIFRAPWIGYAVLTGVLQFVHLVWPINRSVSTVVVATLAICALGVLLVGGLPRDWTWHRVGVGVGLAFALVGISLAVFLPVFNSCTKAMCHYDLGLYYLKLIRWTEAFPIVPGLVNLQEHLAFNQSAFLVISLVDCLVPNRSGLLLVGAFLPWLGLTLSTFALARLATFKLRANANSTPLEVAYAVSAPVWIFTLANANLSSASPDSIISSLSLHLFLIFVSFVVSEQAAQQEYDMAELLLLGVACIAVKSSSLGLVVAVWGVCVALILLGKREVGFILLRKRLLTMAAVASVFLLTWVGRGVILSGYPLFPSSAVSMPVAWRMPVHHVKEFRWDTIRWAREADPSVSVKRTIRTWRWLPGWFERVLALPNQFIWPAQVGMAGSAALMAFGLFGSSVRRNVRNLLLLIIRLIAYMLFWFFTAPHVRYFGPAMWMFAVCPALAFAAGGIRVGLTSTLATFLVDRHTNALAREGIQLVLESAGNRGCPRCGKWSSRASLINMGWSCG
jgi:hypothetical protein